MQINEIRENVHQLANAWEDFKVVNDRRLKSIEEKGYSSSIDDEHLDKLNNAIDDCQGRIDAIENSSLRPSIDGESLEQRKAFRDYLRKGTTADLFESKVTSRDPGSGIALTQGIYKDVLRNLTCRSAMRQVASVDTISTDSMSYYVSLNVVTSQWGGDNLDAVTKGLPKSLLMNIGTNTISACPIITRRLLEDAEVDIDEWITNAVIESFSRAENYAFFKGDGHEKPMGLLRKTSILKASEKLILSDPKSISTDELLALYYSLNHDYARNASFVMNRSTAHYIRGIKSHETGQYIWQPGLQSNPDRLMGTPVYESGDIPQLGGVTEEDAAGNGVVIAFGDFKRCYKIIDRSGVTILRDQFSCKPNVAFYVTKRVGGDIMDSNAVRFLAMPQPKE